MSAEVAAELCRQTLCTASCCQHCQLMGGEKRKLYFVENDMTGGHHPGRMEVKTSIAAMICWVAKQDAWHRSSIEFVGRCGCLIGGNIGCVWLVG